MGVLETILIIIEALASVALIVVVLLFPSITSVLVGLILG